MSRTQHLPFLSPDVYKKMCSRKKPHKQGLPGFLHEILHQFHIKSLVFLIFCCLSCIYAYLILHSSCITPGVIQSIFSIHSRLILNALSGPENACPVPLRYACYFRSFPIISDHFRSLSSSADCRLREILQIKASPPPPPLPFRTLGSMSYIFPLFMMFSSFIVLFIVHIFLYPPPYPSPSGQSYLSVQTIVLITFFFLILRHFFVISSSIQIHLPLLQQISYQSRPLHSRDRCPVSTIRAVKNTFKIS